MREPVAVIDIGSNTIKLLVATRAAAGPITTLHFAAEEVRISRGLGAARPVLSEEGMARGLAAIQRLLAVAGRFAPRETVLVATSAVRDAANGAVFCARIAAATGHPVRILTGDEEANFIGRGLMVDPALTGLCDFYLFDLGGGSLECLMFCGRATAQALSLPLGCVRLTESCVPDPAQPFTAADRASIAATVREVLAASGFRFALPPASPAVATGGTVTAARAILAAQTGRSLEETPATVSTAELEQLLGLTAPLPLPQRRAVPGLPSKRADVFPAALATLLEVAGLAQVDRFAHSFYNLRYGIAAESLDRTP